MVGAVCERCGAALVRGRRGPAPRFCSNTCRARACDARAREDGRYEGWAQNARVRRRATWLRECGYDDEGIAAVAAEEGWTLAAERLASTGALLRSASK